MLNRVLKIHERDNVLVALTDLHPGEQVSYQGQQYTIAEEIPVKHKFTAEPVDTGSVIVMYGVVVGRAIRPIVRGGLVSVDNTIHQAEEYKLGPRRTAWTVPDISAFAGRSFQGYHRANGSIGTANYWIVLPLVFCENRNLEVLKELFLSELGFGQTVDHNYREWLRELIAHRDAGDDEQAILNRTIPTSVVRSNKIHRSPYFPNVDGIKFLEHTGGCGGTRQDAEALCGLLAGYVTHPNVAGATVLSLGCQHAQIGMLESAIAARDPGFSKPLYILEQQQTHSEQELIQLAISRTFAGLMQANKLVRQPAPLSELCIGLECGGSDGFSGISANPVMGYVSDMLVALGGTAILSEFPELCGIEQEISDRCIDEEKAKHYMHLMEVYNDRAKAVNSGFDMNPSPGNIRDGLITDAIKSAGAARKGGTSPVTDVLDYPQKVVSKGLNLLCTPGNDVESTTAEVAAGANIVLFSTGLGTPTGNPVAPVVKISSNTALFEKMPDIIDINTGTVIEGKETIQQAGERMLNYIIDVASGSTAVKAMLLGQEDFIPWKRGVSL